MKSPVQYPLICQISQSLNSLFQSIDIDTIGSCLYFRIYSVKVVSSEEKWSTSCNDCQYQNAIHFGNLPILRALSEVADAEQSMLGICFDPTRDEQMRCPGPSQRNLNKPLTFEDLTFELHGWRI